MKPPKSVTILLLLSLAAFANANFHSIKKNIKQETARDFMMNNTSVRNMQDGFEYMLLPEDS